MNKQDVYKDELYDLMYEFYKEESVEEYGLDRMTLTINQSGETEIKLHKERVPYNLALFVKTDKMEHWLVDNPDCYFSEEENEWFIEREICKKDMHSDYIDDCYLDAQGNIWFKNTGYIDGKLCNLNWVS